MINIQGYALCKLYIDLRDIFFKGGKREKKLLNVWNLFVSYFV